MSSVRYTCITNWVSLVALLLICSAISASAASRAISPKVSAAAANLTPEEIGRRVASTVLARKEFPVDYRVDFPLQALLAFGDATNDKKFLDFVESVMSRRQNSPGYVHSWKTEYFSSLSFDLFVRTRNKNYAGPFLAESHRYRTEGYRTSEGLIGYFNDDLGNHFAGTPVHTFPSGSIYLRKDWEPIAIDQAQEYASRMAKSGCLSGDRTYFTEAARQFELLRAALRDPQTGLWGHARGWFGSVQTPVPAKWARGEAWLLRGLVEALTYMPPESPDYRRVLAMLRELSETLVKYQDDTGFWHQIMDRPDSYQETSATGMISYYFARAVRQKLLDEMPYRERSIRAFQAITQHKVSGDGVVYGASTGTTPMPSIEDYLHWETPANDAHGVAAVIYSAAGRIIVDGSGVVPPGGHESANCKGLRDLLVEDHPVSRVGGHLVGSLAEHKWVILTRGVPRSQVSRL